MRRIAGAEFDRGCRRGRTLTLWTRCRRCARLDEPRARAFHDRRVRELPSGTVTFLFTDIEGSTRLLHEHGERYAEAARGAPARLCATRSRDTAASRWTRRATRSSSRSRARPMRWRRRATVRPALGGGPIRVRMGLHTGEPIATEEGYVGIDVHRAARIAAAGHGGQVLVSQATRDLAGDADLRDLGEHRLKDLVGAGAALATRRRGVPAR